MTHDELSRRIADDLFTNGFDEYADHLVLMTSAGRNLGGWSKSAVIQRLTKLLKASEEELKESE